VDEVVALNPARRATLVWWCCAVALYGLHLALVCYFEPPALLFGQTPMFGCDFDTHAEQAWRVLEGLSGWGRSWVYDVHLLAGHPNGVIFDADNKAWELLTYALVRWGMRKEQAFNAFVILTHVSLVPIVAISARLFGLSRNAVLIAAGLGSAIWFFDAHIHFLWWVGTVAYTFSSFYILLPISLFFYFCETRRVWAGLLCALATATAHLIHPYSFFALLVPMTALYARAHHSLSAGQRAVVGLIVVSPLLLNGYWLITAIQQWHYVLDSSFIGQASAAQLIADFTGLVFDETVTGIIPNRTMVRFIVLGAALIALRRYVQSADRRWLPLGAGLGFVLAAAYFASYSRAGAQVQPYRFIDPAMFLATIPAAEFFETLCRVELWMRLRAVAAPTLLALVLIIKALSNEVLGYFEESLPDVPPSFDGTPALISVSGYKPTRVYRHIPDHPFFWLIAKWVQHNATQGGRVLVDNGVLGEQLAWRTDAEILGGFIIRNLEHSRANLFRRRLQGDVTREQVRAYLEAYDVEWVVLLEHMQWIESMPELFVWHADIAGAKVYRTRTRASRFELGSGQITAQTNELRVTHSDPRQELRLRYHFHEMLVCRPVCKIEPYDNPVGGVPFIRVPAPHPADFEVVNSYILQR
jgi:hypothetical protein